MTPGIIWVLTIVSRQRQGFGYVTIISMYLMQALALFIVTAIAEIVGCYLPYLWLRRNESIWLLVPAAISLGLFAWLLTLHPTAAGRTYAAYGGVYVATATLWLRLVDDQPLCTTDIVGAAMAITGMGIIFLGARAS